MNFRIMGTELEMVVVAADEVLFDEVFCTVSTIESAVLPLKIFIIFLF